MNEQQDGYSGLFYFMLVIGIIGAVGLIGTIGSIP